MTNRSPTARLRALIVTYISFISLHWPTSLHYHRVKGWWPPGAPLALRNSGTDGRWQGGLSCQRVTKKLMPSSPTKQTRVSPKPDLIPWDPTPARVSDEGIKGWNVPSSFRLCLASTWKGSLSHWAMTVARYPAALPTLLSLPTPTQHSPHAGQGLGQAG